MNDFPEEAIKSMYTAVHLLPDSEHKTHDGAEEYAEEIKLSVEGAESTGKEKPKQGRSWKKPKDKPKRPLSAYNLFFQHERKKLLASKCEQNTLTARDFLKYRQGSSKTQPSNTTLRRRHRKIPGMIGFAELARTISAKWKEIDPETKHRFETAAAKEKDQYKIALARWRGDLTSISKDVEEAADVGLSSPVRCVSLDHSSSSYPTSSALGTTVAGRVQQASLPLLLGVLRHSIPTTAPPSNGQSPEVVFFPRLMPVKIGLASSNQSQPRAAQLFSRAKLSRIAAFPTVATGHRLSQRMYLPPFHVYPRELALQPGFVGLRNLALRRTAFPPVYGTLLDHAVWPTNQVPAIPKPAVKLPFFCIL